MFALDRSSKPNWEIRLHRGVHWSARLSAAGLLFIVALFAIGQGVPNPMGQPVPVVVEFVAMGLMLLGFVVGWHWSGIGGAIAIFGFVLFFVAEFVANSRLPGGILPLFAIPGVLLLCDHVLKKRMANRVG